MNASAFSSSASSSGSTGNKYHSTPYLQRVEEALSRALSQMEPFKSDHSSGETPSSQPSSTPRRRCCVMRPHVELGTAPITVERIEDVQKIHRCARQGGGSSTAARSKKSFATPGAWNTQPSGSNCQHYARGQGAATDVANTNPPVPVKSKIVPSQLCLIESTSNSVRISFLFKAQAKAQAASASATPVSNQDPLEASILFQWMRFLMVQEQHPLLRKRPLEGYSVTFLVTNKHVAVHDQGGATKTIQESILGFCSRVDKECSDIKLQVNAQARYITTEFCKAFNQTTTESGPLNKSSSGNRSDDCSGVALANE